MLGSVTGSTKGVGGGEGIHVKREPPLVILAVWVNLFTLDSNERKLNQLQTSLL